MGDRSVLQAAVRAAGSSTALVAVFGAMLAGGGCGRRSSGAPTLNLITTTSTQDSGLLDRLVPAAERSLGLHIRVIAVGSGEAIKLAERGEADVLMAHSPAAEEKSVAGGHLVDRVPLMWNQFVIVGPVQDPAKIAGLADPAEAFRRIRAVGATFVSRGDDSGTHKKELEIARVAGLDPRDPKAHIVSTGQGQGETLMVANERAAYALCDSATWANMQPKLRSKTQSATDPGGLAVLVAGTGAPGAVGQPPPIRTLVNPYHVMRASETLHPGVNVAGAKRFLSWVRGPEAAPIITAAGFTLGVPPGS